MLQKKKLVMLLSVLLIMLISLPISALEFEEDSGYYILTESEITALGEYIIELEGYKDKYYTLEERLEYERSAHDESIEKADTVIDSLEKENEALKEQVQAIEKAKQRSNIFRDAKMAGGGAAIATVIILLKNM